MTRCTRWNIRSDDGITKPWHGAGCWTCHTRPEFAPRGCEELPARRAPWNSCTWWFEVAAGGPRPGVDAANRASAGCRSVEHTSELQSLMRNSYAVFCLKEKYSRL